MINFFFALTAIVFSVTLRADTGIECGQKAFLVEVDMPFNQESLRYCSIRHEGEIIKHGPYQRLNADGVVIESSNFHLGEKRKANNPLKKRVTDKKSAQKKIIDQIFKRVFLQLFNLSEEKKLVIFRSKDGHCKHSPSKRAKFALIGTAYSQDLNFDKKCFFKGKKHYEFDKNLTSQLKGQNLNGYTSITLKYRIERKQKNGTIYIDTTYSDSQIENEKGEKIKFGGVFRVRVVPREVQRSSGQTGIYLDQLEVDVYNFHGETISYKKSI